MSTITEGNYRGEGVTQSEERSFEACTVLSGQNLLAMTVCGKVNVSGVGGLAIPAVAGAGNGTMTGLTAGPNVQVGDYVIACTTAVANGGVFSVTAPDGTVLDSATVGTAYKSDHISFLLNDGSSDYTTSSTFTVSVAAGTTATVVGGGDGTVTGISVGPLAQRGTYIGEITGAVTNGGVVQITAPDGEVIEADSITAGASGTLVVTSSHLNLTITDGSTDFSKGAVFRVVVFGPAAAAKVVAWDPQATDGRQNVAGVLLGAVDATSADTAGTLMVRRGAVHRGKLKWIATASAADKALAYQQLDARTIVVDAVA